MKRHPLVRSLALEIRLNLYEELRAWYELLTANWFYAGLLLVATVVILVQVNPMPPTEIFLGTGQKGSSYRNIGKEFASYFSHYGITLQSVDSRGLSEDLNRVIAPESPVSAGFYVAGSADPSTMKGIVSLGSIQFSPIWIFYRGPEINSEEGLSRILKSRVAIGNASSSSNAIFSKMALLHGVDINQFPEFLHMPHVEAAENLRQGKIDAMAIVDSIDSPLIQSLLHAPGIHVLDFVHAEAYQKQLPFLHELVIPARSISLEKGEPRRAIHLLSTTVTLLVEADTHPVVQWIYLKAARHISNTRGQFFSDPGYFPVYLDHSLPLSKVAKRYYQTGLPPLSNFVPLWVADLIDRAWFYVLAGFTLFIPAVRMLVASRTYYSNQIIENAFMQLKLIDQRIAGLLDERAARELLVEIDKLLSDVEACWIASNSIKDVFALKARIDSIRDDISAKIDLFVQAQIRNTEISDEVVASLQS